MIAARVSASTSARGRRCSSDVIPLRLASVTRVPGSASLAIGAEVGEGGGDLRVWAPQRRAVHVVIDGAEHALEREADGHFRGLVAAARAGTRYRFRLDDEREAFPDPASRFQPEGPHGPSE